MVGIVQSGVVTSTIAVSSLNDELLANKAVKVKGKSKDTSSQDATVKIQIKIGTVEIDDGSKVKTTYDEKTGTYTIVTYDKNGKKTQSQVIKTDGSVSTSKYDKDGNKTSTVVVTADGTTTKTKYDTKTGKPKSKTKVDTEGNKSVTSYNSKGEKTKKTVKGADGSKTVVTYKDGVKSKSVKTAKNGDVTTSKYNEKGKIVTKEVKDADTGNVSNTEYKYKNDKLTSAKTVTTNAAGEKLTYTDTTYNADGKKSEAVTKNAANEEISKTTYKYNSDGKLTSTKTTKPDGSVKDTNYDPKTGNRKSSVEKLANGEIISSEYNINTNKKTSQKIVNTDKDGNVTRTRTYTYDKDGHVSTRMMLDKNGEVVNVSKYTRNDDGTVTRTDYSSDGEYTGGMTFKYDSAGRNTQKVAYDADGKVTSTTNYKYNKAGVCVSENKLDSENRPIEKKKYSDTGVLLSNNKYKYSKDGQTIGKYSAEYDKNGKLISETRTGVYQKTGEMPASIEDITYKLLDYAKGQETITEAGQRATDLLGSYQTLIQDVLTQAMRENDHDMSKLSGAQVKYDNAIQNLLDLSTKVQEKQLNAQKALDNSTEDNRKDAIKNAMMLPNVLYGIIEKPITDAANEILNNPNAAEDLKKDAQNALNELKQYKDKLQQNMPGIGSVSDNVDVNYGNTTEGVDKTDGVQTDKSEKVEKTHTYTRDTQGRVVAEFTIGSDGSKAVENYTFDQKTNRLNVKTSVNEDGTYNRAYFTYNKDGSVKSIAKTTVAADGTVKTITTSYDNKGNVTGTKETECPEGMQKYQILRDVKEKKSQIS